MGDHIPEKPLYNAEELGGKKGDGGGGGRAPKNDLFSRKSFIEGPYEYLLRPRW